MNIYEILTIILTLVWASVIFLILKRDIRKDDKELENYKKERGKK